MKTYGFGVLILLVLFASCSRKSEKLLEVNPEFSTYINGFTNGEFLSTATHFTVRLNNVPDTDLFDSLQTPNLFSFKPAIEGQTRWIDSRTLEFIPSQKLKSNTIYKVSFQVGKLFKVPDNLNVMEWEVKTLAQSFSIEEGNLLTYPDQMRYYRYENKLTTADNAEDELIEKMLQAKFAGKSLKIKWNHVPNSNTHIFYIDSLKRQPESSKLILEINGELIDAGDTEKNEVRIPGVNEFEVLKVETSMEVSQTITIHFSDPLKKNQDLNGIIYLSNGNSLNINYEGNVVTAVPVGKVVGDVKIHILKSIRNALSYPMKNDYEFDIRFESLKPAVRFPDKGVIAPQKDGLVIPFEAVSLNMVDVSIIQIYEDNVLFFLQENDFNESSNIRRAGRLVARKRIDLRKSGLNISRWNSFKINLSDFVTPQAGAIYRISIDFKKEYSAYPCETTFAAKSISSEEYDFATKNDMKDYDEYQYYYDWEYEYDYPEDYQWRERENPCHSSYYTSDKRTSRNLLVSDLGIIAKGSSTGQFVVAVTDIVSAKAISNAKVTLYNLQRQPLSSGSTDGNGFYHATLSSKPSFVVVENGDQKGYLKLGSSDALSQSNFDVSGTVMQEGMKGFIYGERGVWRPGDPMYISFILEDKYNQLPDNYPIRFSLYNPSNQLVESRVVKFGVNGFYAYHTRTPEDAITGNWTLKVQAGNAVFSRTIKVETIKPNRLRSKIDFGKELLNSSKTTKEFPFTASWLHGSPAAGLRYDVILKARPKATTFNKYTQYNFDNKAHEFETEEINLADGYFDSEGKAGFTIGSHFDNAPGFVDANMIIRVFEKSGDFSITTQNITVSPFRYYAGARILSKGERGWYDIKQKQQLGVIVVNENGRPVSERNVEVKIYKVDWRWWWESHDNLAHYIRQNSHSLVQKFNAKTNANGTATVNFKLKHSSYHDNGRYLIVVKELGSDHVSSFTAYFSEWYGSIGGVGEEANILVINSDKEKYNVGETAKISFPSSAGAEAIVSLEKGNEIVDIFRVATTDKQTQFEIPVKTEMAPGVYVSISLIQPHANTANDHPIRMYGILPIEVESPETRLNPIISMPEKLEPEKEFTVNVTENEGKEMTYTLAIVDEGLLDITAFRTPDPWSRFYSREALQVRTWDLYDYVVGAYGAKLDNAVAVGGGDKITDPSKSKAQRFKPVVLFSGPHKLEAGKTGKHSFKMPNYIGSVRVMVVAGNQAAYGNAEKTVPVKKELMLLTTLPRVIGPDEEINVPVTIFAMDSKVKKVTVSLQTNKMFGLKGSVKQTISFDKLGEKIVYFPVKAAQMTGKGVINIEAVSGSYKATEQIEIPVRNPNLPQTVVYDTLLASGKTWKKTVKAFGIPGTNSAQVELAGMVPINLQSRLDYLIHYPYGCLEQTISSVFPQLYLSSIINLSDDQITEIQENINAGLQRLRRFQLPNGAFSYWPEREYSSVWATNYAGHFLLEAKAKGYKIPEDMLSAWISFQNREANQWTRYDYHSSDIDQGYRLYLLAKAGKPNTSAMNRMRETDKIFNRARILLAGAYSAINQNTAASKILTEINSDFSDWNYSSYDYSFGSETRDKALYLMILTDLGRKTEAFDLVKEIGDILSSNQWLSTQSTAMSLMAISKFFDGKTTDGKYEATLTIDGQKSEASFSKALYSSSMMVNDLKNHKVEVKNKSKKDLYVKISLTGTPAGMEEKPESKNLRLTVDYEDMSGVRLDPSKIAQGTDFKATVTVTNTGLLGDYYNISLTQIFPSGWEIINSRLFDLGSDQSFQPDYMDIRDDRISYFMYLRSGRSVSFTVMLNAAYEGKFYLPAIHSGAMYDNKIKAVLPGQWVEVVRAGVN
ncbi:MAG: hypothetical protein JXR34_02475 [Bacteroidales bacterium]|nr:hypothetical protein [Bacteroidales bacterium]